jgi:short-subunit dehydrogenase
MGIQNKTIVITGASKGLGRAMAIQYARQQANIIFVARTQALLKQVREEIQTLTGVTPAIIVCDISSENDVRLMMENIEEKYARVDVLINNAGIGTYRVSEQLSNHEMRNHFAVNFFGAYYCTKALLPLLKQSKSGYILNIGSLFSKIALAENSVYAATKFALAGFSEGLRRELQPFGIKVGLFLAGPMNTAFQKNKGENNLQVPGALMLDPQKVAVKLQKMIRNRRKQMILPSWMMLAVKLKYR